MALVMVLTRRFSVYYEARPVLTTMVTNAVRLLRLVFVH
jgi:hypothetical protein